MRENYFILFSRAIVIVLQLANIKLLTAYLEVGDIGLYFFLISASYFTNALLFVPADYFQQAYISCAAIKKDAVKVALLFNLKIICTYLLLAALAGVVLLLAWPQHLLLFVLGAAGSMALHVMQSLRNLLNNCGHGVAVSISQITEALVRVGLFLGASLLGFASLELVATAWALSLITTALYVAWVAKRLALFDGVATTTIKPKEFLRFSTPISFSAITNWLQVQGYRIVLVPLGYAEVVGIFSTISNIGSSAIGAVNLIYHQKFSPKIYQSQGDYTTRYLRQAMLLILFTVAAFALGGKYIVELLTTSEFQSYWSVILYGVSADAANMIVGALTIYLTIKKTTNTIFLCSVAGFLFNAAIFGALYSYDQITVYSVGLPILISQWVVAALLFNQFRASSKNEKK